MQASVQEADFRLQVRIVRREEQDAFERADRSLVILKSYAGVRIGESKRNILRALQGLPKQSIPLRCFARVRQRRSVKADEG